MTELERLISKVETEIPNATVVWDKPWFKRGTWFVNISHQDLHVVVEWRPQKGFGVSVLGENDIFGDGPDEVFCAVEEAFRWVRDELCRCYSD